ncbi:hypothetical protein ACGRHY_30025 [Streptomyces sp. HK10]|uniref:hypothetical protein n=1 Tax=Streptomyces sp. HK10 TaxID=3373255 RepID=UPI0037478502
MNPTTPTPHPDVLHALAAVETAGTAARQALATVGGPAPADGATGPGMDTDAATLPAPREAAPEDLLTAVYALSAQLTAGPRTGPAWGRAERLALWLADAAGWRRDDAPADTD